MLFAIIAPANAHSLELCGILDALAEANMMLPQQRQYEAVVLAEQAQAIPCQSGMRIIPHGILEDLDGPADTLIVAGAYGVPFPASPSAADWLRREAKAARRYGSACTGAFWLGAAGLLDGRRVTTHWAYAAELARQFRKARVEADRIVLRDGRLVTAGGVTAAIDMTLALIEEDHGHALALWVARRLVTFLRRPGGQAQYSVNLAAPAALRENIERVQMRVRNHPDENHSLGALARRAAMSERNFSRVFRRETGMSAADFVEKARIDAVRRLLESGPPSVDAIAVKCGFSGQDAMRRAFVRQMQVTPGAYRRAFRSALEGGRNA
ncbi:GlxA family transcriptional regulator [Sphingomonas cavernae]|uniref:Helix-turn-helix domain-containing protein n=1 Tax=Sphingomonas cavernae TaxID=2320861 RepID=A0A418W7W2_9SPHN|nr:helix-turn-helix domain-containing protein [Sphingomonas cavernae]RJF86093.1 helix-turn-helix domain-containing protein [Sphingomonas cavernae]